jgi:uncharacterized membrane protein
MNLTENQRLVLDAVCVGGLAQKPVTRSVIREKTGLPDGSVASALRALESRGMIARPGRGRLGFRFVPQGGES